MRITEVQLCHVRIPLKGTVKHASHARRENDTILVRVRLDGGTIGWGEGLPRPYVTGETIDTAWQQLSELDLRQLSGPFQNLETLAHLVRQLDLGRTAGKRACFGNAARCALELAILDAGCRALQVPLSTFIRELPEAMGLTHCADEIQYSAVLTASSGWKLALRSGLYRLCGFRQCKVKVGVPGQDDRQVLRRVRRYFGQNVALRIDANEAWPVSEVVARCNDLASFQIQSVEQPVPHRDVAGLAAVRGQVRMPIMLDESLCCREDAEWAIAQRVCDAFNLRLSKCGGILPTVELAQIAAKHGITCQLGCQVGETGILSAAGRHFAATIGGLSAVEGSFDRLLVREPLTQENLTFGWAGKGPALQGGGLGVTVDERAVQRVNVRRAVRSVPPGL